MTVLCVQVLAAHRRLQRKMAKQWSGAVTRMSELQGNEATLHVQALKEEADFSAAAWRRRDLCRQTCKIDLQS